MIKAGEKAKAADVNENGISENGFHSKGEQENHHVEADKEESVGDTDAALGEEDANAVPSTPKKKKPEQKKPVKAAAATTDKQSPKKQPPKLSLKTKKSEKDGNDDDEVKTSFKDMRYYGDEGEPIPRSLNAYFGGSREQMEREYLDAAIPNSHMGRLIKAVLYQVVADDPERFPTLHKGLQPEVDEDGDVVGVSETIKITNGAYELLHGAAEEHLRRVFKVADGFRQASSVIGLNHVHLRAAANIDLLEKSPESRFNFKDHEKGFLIRTKRRTLDLKTKEKRFNEMHSMSLRDYLLKHKAPDATMTDEEILAKEEENGAYPTHTVKRLETPTHDKTFVYEEMVEESMESEESDSEDNREESTPTKSKPKKAANNTNAKKVPVKKEPNVDKKKVTFKKIKKEKTDNAEEEEEEQEEETPTPSKKKVQAKAKPAPKRKASEVEEEGEEEEEKPQKKKAKTK